MAAETQDTRLFGKPPVLAMVIGAKNSGKSELVRFIAYTYARDFAHICVVSPTALNQFYQSFIPSAHIHDTYSDDLIQKLVDRQEALKKSGKQVHALLILDDILASPDVRFEKRTGSVLNLVFAANRHYNLSVLIVAQKLKGLPTICRQNADYVCITRCMRSAWADLYEEYGNADKKEFYKTLEECTTDYRILMYKAKVKRSTDHYSCFAIPESFLSRRFKLVY